MNEHLTDNQKKWDRRHLRVVEFEIKTWSKDPSTQVGALIVKGKNWPISWGYNGLPAGIDDSPELLENREIKLGCVIHAEENAIGNSPMRSLKGCTLFVTAPPCTRCAAKIIQKQISRVVHLAPTSDFLARYADNLALAREILDEAGVQVDMYPIWELK